MRRTLISVALVAIALASAACVADPPPPQKVSRTDAPAGVVTATMPATLNGKTARITYDSGAVETLTFGPDGKSVTAVTTDSRVSTESRPAAAPAAVIALESGVFLVSWAADGGVVSQVQDYRTGEVRGTWSHRDDPAAPFIVETRSGSVRLVE